MENDFENELKEPAPKYNQITPEQYLEMERISDTKHEYHNGEIFAMAGASNAHNDIAFNINRLIAPFLHGKSCKLYGSDFRIYIPENTLFTYPDFSIVCGKTETSDIYTDNLTNPATIIEILSPSSKDYDRGTKFNFYRLIKTLKEYILIDSGSVHVELFVKQPDKSWNLKEFKQLTDNLFISTINFQLSLSNLYDDVQLSSD
jgi:Uma2 family endonuclease